MANNWRDSVDKVIKPHLEAQIKAAAFNRDSYKKAKDPSNAQLWIAIANLSKQILDLNHQVKYLEKTLKEILLKQPNIKKAKR